jgi:hypothetical protein
MLRRKVPSFYRISLALVLILTACGGTSGTNNIPPTQAASYRLGASCASHTATLLRTGAILLVGCDGDGPALILEPLSGKSYRTKNPPSDFSVHSATPLPDGKVLVIDQLESAAYLYDPNADTWTLSEGTRIAVPDHSTSLMADGRVLIAGGEFGIDWAALYIPSGDAWVALAPMRHGRRGHTATLLRSGQVLVVGGNGMEGLVAAAEVYDPRTGQWDQAGSPHSPRVGHTATLLPDGRVLIVGGRGADGPLAQAELYDPGTNRWSLAGSTALPRVGHTATVVASGQVYVLGGYESIDEGAQQIAVNAAERFDPVTNRWSPARQMHQSRAGHTATLLRDGHIILIGGYEQRVRGSGKKLADAELYTVEPATVAGPTPMSPAWPSVPQVGAASDARGAYPPEFSGLGMRARVGNHIATLALPTQAARRVPTGIGSISEDSNPSITWFATWRIASRLRLSTALSSAHRAT